MNRSQLKELIKEVLMETAVPGDAPPNDQVHVFDFDDTLGLTDNPNGVMMFNDGKPAHKDVASAAAWVKESGLDKYLSNRGKPTIVVSPELGGALFYLDSAGLAQIYKKIPKVVTYDPIGAGEKWKDIYKTQGMAALADYSPSNDVSANTTKPIKSTINKLKSLNSAGAKTAVMTARQGSGETMGLDGKTQPVTNEKDIESFLSKQGAKPNSGIMGVKGKNKGEEIQKKFVAAAKDHPPKEIHFYDDAQRNTDDVSKLAGKVPSELYIYGPGHFDNGEVTPDKPDKSFEEPEEKNKKVAEMIKKMVQEELRKRR